MVGGTAFYDQLARQDALPQAAELPPDLREDGGEHVPGQVGASNAILNTALH